MGRYFDYCYYCYYYCCFDWDNNHDDDAAVAAGGDDDVEHRVENAALYCSHGSVPLNARCSVVDVLVGPLLRQIEQTVFYCLASAELCSLLVRRVTGRDQKKDRE
jgi:hypothetical protein